MRHDLLTEAQHAIALANQLLDDTSADPDDDLCVLARQLLRQMVSKQQYIDALHQLKQAHDREIAERDAAYAVAMERLQNLRAAFDRLLEGIQKAQKLLVRDTFNHERFDNPELRQLLSDLLAPGLRKNDDTETGRDVTTA